MASPTAPRRRWPRRIFFILLLLLAWHFVSRVAAIPGPLAIAGEASDKLYDMVYGGDVARRAGQLPDRITLLLVGLDNRLASSDNHADAIHLLTLDRSAPSPLVITSIPRSTPVTGYGLAEEQSVLANLRRVRGRDTFKRAVAKIAGVDTIDYFVEVSFSQAMGVLELLGYDDPATALQYLRHRKSYQMGDIQRCHNQGAFIKAQLARRGDLLEGAKGDLLLRLGLGLVDSDLDVETLQAILYRARRSGALDADRIALRMVPPLEHGSLLDESPPDPSEIESRVGTLTRGMELHGDTLGRYDPYPRIDEILRRAERAPSAADRVTILTPLYRQKGWLQLQEPRRRQGARDRLEKLLVGAYRELGKKDQAAAVKRYMAEERQAFSQTERVERRFVYRSTEAPPARPAQRDTASARPKPREEKSSKPASTNGTSTATTKKDLPKKPASSTTKSPAPVRPATTKAKPTDEPRVIDLR